MEELPVNIVCIQVGNYLGRGAEYVNNLASMVKRCTTVPYRFICFTDDPTGLDEGIEARPASTDPNLKGWYHKLWLFSDESGLSGRVFFLDLDTLITGRLDDLLAYRGKFAILRDFYRPDGYGSGVMAWEHGSLRHLWETFRDAGFPDLPHGDQEWIEREEADIWQDLFPGRICSYKEHAVEWPPSGVSIVCFHGVPRPHHYPSPWVEQVWCRHGLSPLVSTIALNISRSQVIEHIKRNIQRDIRWQQPGEPTHKTMILVGGGPSLTRSMGELRRRIRKGAHIWAMNNTHDFMTDRGIVPDFYVMMDAREDNVQFVQRPRKCITYYIASRCHPAVFDALEGQNVVMWHSYITDADGPDREVVEALGDSRPWCMISGGSTVGMRAMMLGKELGYTRFHLFGYDSSYHEGDHHAYPQTLNDGERRVTVHIHGKTFVCSPWMIKQVEDFRVLASDFMRRGMTVSVTGTGLLPYVASQLEVT